MIAVFGGAFNPPTIAHYEVAKHVLALPFVNKLLFVPVGDHYEKPGLIPANHRLKMLEMMTDQLSNTDISKVEVEAFRPLKTIETLEKLHARHPKSELAFVMGADNLYKLTNWHDYNRLIRKFKLIILGRGALDVQHFIKAHFEDVAHRFLVINDFPKLDISSTQYRADVTQNELLLSGVEQYIKKHGLYCTND